MTRKELTKDKSEHDFLFFWGHKEIPYMVTKTCLSQWYPCVFEVDGELYSSAEQYMMAEKARLMGDEEVRRQILDTEDPMQIKKLSRKVRNFDTKIWDENKFSVVVKGNLHKFGQNKHLREFLLETGDKVIVEASPNDDIWGIGMEEKHPDAKNPALWRGENLLGFALMEVRTSLQEEAERQRERSLMRFNIGIDFSVYRMAKDMANNIKPVIATKDSWRHSTMPQKHATIQINKLITDEQMSVLKIGVVPQSMEEHWFVYCDNNTIRFIRCYGGYCIFCAKYEETDNGVLISELQVNRDSKEYRGKNDREDEAMFMALVSDMTGADSEQYWNVIYEENKV